MSLLRKSTLPELSNCGSHPGRAGGSPKGNWLAALRAHIPNAGEHLVRYYGWYSNVNRGKRRQAQGEDSPRIREGSEVGASAAERAWARRSAELVEAS